MLDFILASSVDCYCYLHLELELQFRIKPLGHSNICSLVFLDNSEEESLDKRV